MGGWVLTYTETNFLENEILHKKKKKLQQSVGKTLNNFNHLNKQYLYNMKTYQGV